MALPMLAAGLIKYGLPLLAQAVASKGKEWVEEKTGEKLPDLSLGEPSPDVLLKLKQLEFDKAELLVNAALEEGKMALDWMKTETQEVTKRWQADMSSDSWMSKNVRPMVLVYILVAYTVFAVGSAFGFEVKPAYVELMAQWGMLIMTAYFGGRSVEKVVQMMQKGKKNDPA